jgi:transcriptional regulator with XRE-family HTH domain
MRCDDDFAVELRRFRAGRTPGDLGIEGSLPRERRVPGLRRTELATLSGVSEDHLKRLEQGRRHPSEGVVDALARALRVSAEERDRLRTLAGYAAAGAPRMPRELTPPARRMLERVTDVASCVCDASWSVLAGNERWNEFRCGAGTSHGRDRNMVWRVFTEAPTHAFRTPERLTAFRTSLVSDLRATARRYRTDPELHALIADQRTIGDFAALWDGPDPAGERADRLTVDGVELDKDVLVVEPGDLRLVVMTAA